MRIQDLMEKTGYSRSQLQRRLALLRPALNGGVRKGPNNALEFSEEAANLVLKLKELEDQGLRAVDAAAQLLASFGKKPRESEGNFVQGTKKYLAAEWVVAGSCAAGALALVTIAIVLASKL